MSAFISFSVVLFNIIGVITVLSENVPVPENVRVISINLGLVLEWDPPQTTNNHPFKYTAELKGWRGYDPVCQNSSSLTCDFTDNVTIFGSYQLRVRTELDGETSDWVETKQVAVDKITEISAPHVELRSNNGQTEVDITDPPMKRKNLRDVFGNISYLIRFWKKGESNKVKLKREQSRVMLPKVKPLENYCVEVEVLYLKNKTSQPSNMTCLKNSPSNETEPWLIAVMLLISFLVVLVAVLLIFMAVWYSYKGYRIVFPNDNLPEHLKQYLAQRSQSPAPLPIHEGTHLKEPIHELMIYEKKLNSSQDNQQII
ncbi:cytokine receptor family member b4 precursor [Danio rerio]|uniref:cytokine receptor family member B4 n=1 Tax=Danio rerio TaxID=7955 RepID=A0FJH9_DANRE|nr:cytokine receptor family member b4 precursor [Danio rerio]AAI67449.1 Cytokine receptor family member b4 [Danio rerio]ABJ97309.1 cytokine receptor family member B4 [Danio rerio]|eukprot:NP_001077337.1 interleukin-10 receptor subunit beta precursor [Danio rerio]